MILRQMESMPAVIVSGGMAGMGGEMQDAWKQLKAGLAGKASEVTSQIDRVEIALKLAVVASVTAAVFSALSWHANRRR